MIHATSASRSIVFGKYCLHEPSRYWTDPAAFPQMLHSACAPFFICLLIYFLSINAPLVPGHRASFTRNQVVL